MAPAKSTITFDPSLRGTILLTSDDLNIAKDLTIRGPGAGILSISSGNSGHRVCVVQGVTVTISGLTFKDSNTSNGFINNVGTLILINSTVSGNTATGTFGTGGIDNRGTLTLTNSTVSGNTETGTLGPGGIDNGGTLTLTNSTVSGNTGTGNDSTGGIDSNDGTLTLTNSTVSGNTGTGPGGGIDSNDGTLTLTNSTVSGNTVTGSGGVGGGINNNDGTLTLTNSTVSGNTVTGSGDVGGGINNNDGTLTLTDSTVSGNTATNGNGGGILNHGTLTLSNSTVSGNTATNGGGIANTNAKLTLTNSTISDNKAPSTGGGIVILDDTSSGQIPSSAMLLYCTVYGNTAGVGGGIWLGNQTQGQVMSMGASIVAGNKADTDPDIAGSLTTLGYNLVGDRSGATFLGSLKVQSTDVLGVSLTDLGIDPKLRDNGGSVRPHTWTHALLPGSPAFDLIPPEACMMFKVQSDQRGVKRLQGKGCDSGAYE